MKTKRKVDIFSAGCPLCRRQWSCSAGSAALRAMSRYLT
jgi:hypothetical protein